jgi:drug/metabolite transporter (DMT)-like permease
VERRAPLDRIDAMLALLAVIWGSAFPGLKVLGEVLDPYKMTWFRYAPFPVAYGCWILLRRRAALRQVTGRDWITMAVLGFVGVIGYHFPLNWGLHDSGDGVSVSAATGAILIATTPLWTLLISVATGKERLRPLALAGSLVAFAGVAVVVFFGRGQAELTLARKALVILIAPLCWALYSVYTRPLVQRHGGLLTTGLTLSLGALTLLPLGLRWGLEPLGDLQARHWAWLVFLAFLSTILGYAMWNNALKHRTASQVAIYVYFNPVVAATVGYLFLGEHLTGWFLAGAALVLGGVILVNRSRLAPAATAPVPAGTPASPPSATSSGHAALEKP